MSIIVQAFNARVNQWETRNAMRQANMALVGGEISYNDMVKNARDYVNGWRADITNSDKPLRIYDTDAKRVL